MNGAFSCRDVTMYFSSGDDGISDSQLTSFHSNSAVVLECNVFVSPIVSSSNVHIFFSQFEMVFVFVASL